MHDNMLTTTKTRTHALTAKEQKEGGGRINIYYSTISFITYYFVVHVGILIQNYINFFAMSRI